MSGIGRKIGGPGDIFSKKKGDIEAFASGIIALCDNEIRLKAMLNQLVTLLEVRIASGSGSRERLRDMIRSESFAKQFESDLVSVD